MISTQRISEKFKMAQEACYALPFLKEQFKQFKISQGYAGSYSHFSRQVGRFIVDDTYSVDFVLSPKTKIIVARDGLVTGVVDSIDKCYRGLDFKTGVYYLGNHVEIKHEDGTYAYYEHFALDEIFVKEGGHVRQGELLGLLGESGWIGPLPHLHFEVYERNIENFLRKSMPVKFLICPKNKLPHNVRNLLWISEHTQKPMGF